VNQCLTYAPPLEARPTTWHTRWKGKGQIVAVDLPGKRIARLEENLSTLRSEDLKCEIVECDLLEMDASTFEDKSLPSAYDAVMLDAPCSNTGVIQRRTDVKWRLLPKDIKNCAKATASVAALCCQIRQRRRPYRV
jgi:16S rRNA (cytosine967-C5)-methyltransferase